ncbi:MAG: HAMP domain-containing histidine kinase [Oscillospiraceae bacterium]|nr:HAMP domain-containing histidine kinase [Oscillospiraceae bacterium]
MNKKTQGITERFFNPALDLRVQVFNLLAFVGIFAGVGIGALALIHSESIYIAVIDLTIAVLSFIFLLVTEKKNSYHFCSWLFIVVGFMGFFTLLFFLYGGHRSGAAFYFVVALVFTALLLEGYERIAALVLEFILYLSSILLDYFRPELAIPQPSESEYLSIMIINMTAACTIILFVLLLRTQIFNNRHELIEELNRELTSRNDTLAQYDNMKSDFLQTVAHEINTPLAIISASSNDALYLLKETPIKVGEINENLQLIIRRVKLIDSILLDLMDTVAIESGRISLSRSPVSLSHQIRSICDAQFSGLDKNNNNIIYNLAPHLPDVWADSSRLEQVMVNLLSNAVTHTKAGTVTVKLERGEGRQVVSVIDDGEGMEPEVARAVLKQYVSTKADFWRHGIGLYICRQIINAHGGEIWIDSEKGRGTSVFFSLTEGAEQE